MSKNSSHTINQPIGCINFWEATKVYDDLGALYFVLGNDGFILWASASFIEYWDSVFVPVPVVEEDTNETNSDKMSEEMSEESESDSHTDIEETSESKNENDTNSDTEDTEDSEETETEGDEWGWYGGWYYGGWGDGDEYNGEGLGSGEV
jgi:hypothetical protein